MAARKRTPAVVMRLVTVAYRYSPHGVSDLREVIGEFHTDDLAIVPGLTLDGGFDGGWRPTHVRSGRHINGGPSMCLPCARKAVQMLVASGADWSRTRDEINADRTARLAGLKVTDLALTCMYGPALCAGHPARAAR
jgi:hypothetical protein